MESLQESAVYRFKVIVYNEIGPRDSNIVSTVVADVPSTPTSPPSFNAEETTITSIRVVMDRIVDDGGSQIISYHLQRTESGGSVFFDVVGGEDDFNLNSEVQVPNLEKRRSYRFRYRVIN